MNLDKAAINKLQYSNYFLWHGKVGKHRDKKESKCRFFRIRHIAYKIFIIAYIFH